MFRTVLSSDVRESIGFYNVCQYILFSFVLKCQLDYLREILVRIVLHSFVYLTRMALQQFVQGNNDRQSLLLVGAMKYSVIKGYYGFDTIFLYGRSHVVIMQYLCTLLSIVYFLLAVLKMFTRFGKLKLYYFITTE